MSEAPLSVIADINPPLPRHVRHNELVSFVKMQDVAESGGIRSAADFPFGSVCNGFTRFAENDILFAKITPCMENGKGALAKGLTNGIGCGSTEFHVLRAKEDNCPGFIYQVAQSHAIRQKAEMRMSGSAGQQRVQAEFFKTHRVHIPKPPEQRRIAEILTTVDEAMEQTEALVGKLEQMKAGLMHDLFTRGVTPEGKLRPTRQQAPHLYHETPLGWIPKEWEVKPLGHLSEIVSGVTLGSKLTITGGVRVPYLRVANVQDGHLDLATMKTITIKKTEIEKYSVLPGDFLMTEGGDPDKLGRGAIWTGDVALCLHQNHVFRVRCDQSRLTPEYLRSLVGSPYGKAYFLRVAKQTTGIASINKTQLGNFPVQLPPLAHQRAFLEKLAGVQSVIEQQETASAVADSAFQALLHLAFPGNS
ncbi:MAG: restriction endonuclease subunit S [Verrucomicrobiae bacterium]|nr:restriction endonuclease subunit S [Verrucomicrobiae bacterium]